MNPGKNQSEAELLGQAVAIAAAAHQGQFDKSGKLPYILHPVRLMLRGQSMAEKIVAVLHDVVEDSDWTLEQLGQAGFSADLLAAIDCLTRRSEETYDEFIDRILTNPLATRVKRYDLEDNMDITRLETVTTKDLERLQRYHQAHRRVMAALAAS